MECMRINPWCYSTIFHCKPLSANKMYTMRRAKTAAYRKYQEYLTEQLGTACFDSDLPVEDMRFKLTVNAHLSNTQADLDNVLKPLQDTLQTHFGFNDKNIYGLEARKHIVSKGNEKLEIDLTQIFLD